MQQFVGDGSGPERRMSDGTEGAEAAVVDALVQVTGLPKSSIEEAFHTVSGAQSYHVWMRELFAHVEAIRSRTPLRLLQTWLSLENGLRMVLVEVQRLAERMEAERYYVSGVFDDRTTNEYGHAVQDDQVPGFGASAEAGAMGEGFGDFLAASFFADVKAQKLRPTIGNWDAVAYSGAEPPSLRRLDSNKKYPKDLNGEVHDDGEIWSACLWELRTALGRRTTEKLIIAHHFLLTRKATFENAANALITTDKNLNQGRNVSVIRDVFVRRGILPNPKRKNKRAGVPFEETVGKAKRK